MALSAQDSSRIGEAVRAAEMTTAGEIVCVLARASSDYAALPALWAGVVALLVPWPLIVFTSWPVQYIYIAQLAAFAVVLFVLSLGSIRVALTPRSVRRAHAHRAAMEQFYIRGITRTTQRTGVLIFVSLAERYVRIIADEAIDAKVRHEEWQSTVHAMLEQIREDRLAEGFVIAVQRCGAILARHFPPQAEPRNELPNRLFIL